MTDFITGIVGQTIKVCMMALWELSFGKVLINKGAALKCLFHGIIGIVDRSATE